MLKLPQDLEDILELGGNIASSSPTCDLKMTVTGALFGAVGTCVNVVLQPEDLFMERLR